MNDKKRLCWIQVLSIFAILVSLYLVNIHYFPDAANACLIGEPFDCNMVNKSPYARLDGILFFLYFDMNANVPLANIPIPNAMLWALTFLFVFAASRSLGRKKPFFGMNRKKTLNVLKGLLYVNLAYVIYLAYVEAFILYNYCIFCILLDILLVAILWLVIGLSSANPKKAVKRAKPRKRKKRK